MNETGDLLEAMHDVIFGLLVRRGIDDLAALNEAGTLCEDLQRRFGGRDHYIPVPDKSTRNARIAAELAAGRDPQEVAARYGVSTKTVKRTARRHDDPGFGSPDWNLE